MRVEKPLRLSPSSIALWDRCSINFKWSVLDEIEPEQNTGNYYAVLGTAFHKAMELHDLFNIQEQELRKFWRYIFYLAMTEENFLNKEHEWQSFLSRGFDLLKSGMELKKRWVDTDVIWNEKYFRFYFSNKYIDDVYISGKIDLALKGKQNDIYTVMDWKTAKKPNKDVDSDPQMTTYIYFLHKTLNIPYDDIFGAMAFPATEKIFFTQRTEDDVNLFFDNANKMLERISIGDFKKEPKEKNKRGDCFFCPYKNRCEKVRI